MQDFILIDAADTVRLDHDGDRDGHVIDPSVTDAQKLTFDGIALGAELGKLFLSVARDVTTGEKKAVIGMLPPDGVDDVPIPVAVLIDGNPFEQYAPGDDSFVDLDVYRAAIAASKAYKRAA